MVSKVQHNLQFIWIGNKRIVNWKLYLTFNWQSMCPTGLCLAGQKKKMRRATTQLCKAIPVKSMLWLQTMIKQNKNIWTEYQKHFYWLQSCWLLFIFCGVFISSTPENITLILPIMIFTSEEIWKGLNFFVAICFSPWNVRQYCEATIFCVMMWWDRWYILFRQILQNILLFVKTTIRLCMAEMYKQKARKNVLHHYWSDCRRDNQK